MRGRHTGRFQSTESPRPFGPPPFHKGGRAFALPRHSEATKGPWESVFFPEEYGLPRRACGPPRNDGQRACIAVGRGRTHEAAQSLLRLAFGQPPPFSREVFSGGAASLMRRTFPLGGRWPAGPDEGATCPPPCRGAPMCAPSLSSVWPSASHLPRQREAFRGAPLVGRGILDAPRAAEGGYAALPYSSSSRWICSLAGLAGLTTSGSRSISRMWAPLLMESSRTKVSSGVYRRFRLRPSSRRR